MATEVQALPTAMTQFRAALVAVEEARTGTSALVKAARGNENVATAMQPLILSSLESLQGAMRVAQEALAGVVQAASPAKPEPEKKPKAA